MKNLGLRKGLPMRSARILFFAALPVLILLPVLLAPHLLLLDAPAHEARLAILHDLLFTDGKSRFYDLDTFFLPNIAFDVIGFVLTFFVSPEVAGRLFFGLTLLLTMSGVAVLNRVAIGRWSIVPFASAIILYNLVTILGFFSYAFGLALVPWALAGWIYLDRYPPVPRGLVGASFGIILLFCHVFDFGIYAIMSTGFAITALMERRIGFNQIVLRALEIVPAGLIFLLMSTHISSRANNHPFSLTAKGFGLAKSMTSGSLAGDLAFGVGIASLVLLLALCSWPRLVRSFIPGLIGLSTLYFILPANMASGSYVDIRMPIAIALLTLAGLDVQFQKKATTVVFAAIFVIAVAAKQIAISVLWRSFSAPVDELVQTLNTLPSGAIIMQSECQPESGGILGIYRARQPPMQHVAALSNFGDVRFVAETYAISGQQPIRVASSYKPYYALQSTFAPTCDPSEYHSRLSQIEALAKAETRTGEPTPPLYLLLVRPPEPFILSHDAKLLNAGSAYSLYGIAPQLAKQQSHDIADTKYSSN